MCAAHTSATPARTRSPWFLRLVVSDVTGKDDPYEESISLRRRVRSLSLPFVVSGLATIVAPYPAGENGVTINACPVVNGTTNVNTPLIRMQAGSHAGIHQVGANGLIGIQPNTRGRGRLDAQLACEDLKK